jgi:hypothetical protein
MPTSKELEALFVNNADFRQIQTHLNRFNPIKIMQASQSEIRNSSVLAWLLDPHENHGLGDDFLRAFLAGALKHKEANISALEVLSSDLSDVEVKTEQNPDFNKRTRMDIVIDCPSEQWIFIVENKLGSSQSEQQLKKYFDALKKRLDREGLEKTKIQGIYLTLDGEDPSPEVGVNFVPFTHQEYAEQIRFLVQQRNDTLSSKIVDFLEYFIEVMMENSSSNHEEEQRLQEIAKRLYREHRRVIDYIVEHGTHTVLTEAFSSLIDDYPKNKNFKINEVQFSYVRGAKKWLSFIPSDWQVLLEQAKPFVEPDSPHWPGCEKWRLPTPVGLWVELREIDAKHRIRMAMEVGPLTDFKPRLLLIEAIDARAKANNTAVNFGEKAKKEGTKYSIFKESSVSVKNADDYEDLKKNIEEALKELIPYVPIVTDALRDWIEQLKNMASSDGQGYGR